ncbi:spondin domain-containing protein [Cytophaga sp. FL35]|uniref:spondin domain-containing protein n=1 Tax=Cytophaga sp. FL35 TaxID=1904456 RepID=UPI001CA3AB11|nr:spondin domain-containing protein [Cytophaga sp. FL35]
MKTKKLLLLMVGVFLLAFASCEEDNEIPVVENTNESSNPTTEPEASEEGEEEVEEEMVAMADFTVTIENVVTPKPIFESGVFAVPVGQSGPAPLFPGDAYAFEINAGPHVLPGDGGTRLSFVTMFVQSNDLFFAPNEEGIALYEENGAPICGDGPVDVTDQVLLWDAGTEVNEQTGGPNQKPQQAPDAMDQGEDENGVVTEVKDNSCAFGNELPTVAEVIKVTIELVAPARFKVKIKNVSTATTISVPAQGENAKAAVPISPGVFAVHTAPAPFFVEGEAAAGAGLIASETGVEDVAEDGFLDALYMDTKAATGLIVPLSPGAWAVHKEGIMPLFEKNMPDFGEGLEGLAEDGNVAMLGESLMNKEGIMESGIFNTPVGASEPGPIGPGGQYQFSFTAEEGYQLSLATMFVQSNDWFYSFKPEGLPLFKDGEAMMGDVTEYIYLFDAGTEIDEYPGAGIAQVIRQGDMDAGEMDSNSNVRVVTGEEFDNIPANSYVLKVSIEAN